MHLNLMYKPSDELLGGEKETPVYYLNEEENPIQLFGPVQKVNIFLGANNSGKSRFLRGLLKHPSYDSIDLQEYIKNSSLINEIAETIIGQINAEHIVSISIESSRVLKHSATVTAEILKLIKFNEDRNISIAFPVTYFEKIINLIGGIKLNDSTQINKSETDLIKAQLELSVLIDVLTHYQTSRHISAVALRIIQATAPATFYHLIPSLKRLVNALQNFKIKELRQSHKVEKRIYIPILRSATSLYKMQSGNSFHVEHLPENDGYKNMEKAPSNIFEVTTVKNYKFHGVHFADRKITIETGLNLYQSIRLTRNSQKQVRKGFEAFESFLSENFFNHEGIDIVAKEQDVHNKNDEHIIVYIGKEKVDRDIHDLGDGVQALIIMMYAIFTAPKNSWIYIEEPEVNLHPGLQRIFLEQITSNTHIAAKGLRFFITTHSNHLLDLTLTSNEEISIFTFQKEISQEKNYFRIRNVLSGDTDILRLLGVRNSSVFIANCSIWVEGVTDRIYIKAFLKAYCKEFKKRELKEDIEFAFFEYSGSNISHYLFTHKKDLDLSSSTNEIDFISAHFLANRIFLIADKDSGKEAKHSFLGGQANENFVYHVLKCREIENLIAPRILRKVILEIFNGRVSNNSKSLLRLTRQDVYRNVELGGFLLKKFKGQIPKSFVSKGGKAISPYYKKKIAKIATLNLEWEDMSKEARKLATEIYAFIQKYN